MTKPKARPERAAVPDIENVELPGMPPAPDEPTTTDPAPPVDVKRGRGRPKGSATKPKPPVTDAAPRPPGRPSNSTKLRQGITSKLAMVGLAVGMLPVQGAAYDGAVIISGADALAGALCAVAETNPAVRKALESMLNASAWGQVATALLGIVIPIMSNHAPALVAPDAARLVGGANMVAAEKVLGQLGADVPEPMWAAA